MTDRQRQSNRKKSKTRARVEHCLFVMKRQFGFITVRYKGLAKNAHFLFISCALVNLVMVKKTLMKKRRTPARVSFA